MDVDPGVRPAQTLWIDDADEYLALFEAARPDQLILEGCIYNVYSPAAPERIRHMRPSARFLVQLRDPVEQMYSNHALKVIMRDTPSDDFEQAIAIGDRQRAGRPPWSEPPVSFKGYDLRDKAIVSFGLARFIQTFGRDNFHVTLFDDFAADDASVYRSIFAYAGIDPAFTPKVKVLVPNRVARVGILNRAMGSKRLIASAKRVVPKRLHSTADRAARVGFRLNRRVVERPHMKPELRDRLRADMRPEVERLSELVGMDLVSRWWS